MFGLGAGHHGVADLDANTKRRLGGSEKIAGFAAQLQNALAGLYDELQKALDAAVKIFVGADPFGALGRNRFLMTPSRFAQLLQGRRPQLTDFSSSGSVS